MSGDLLITLGVATLTGIATLVLYVMSFKPSLDYVTFMKVEKTAYLKIRFDRLYSIYILFAAAIIVRYAWILWGLARGKAQAAPDPDTVSSGL